MIATIVLGATLWVSAPEAAADCALAETVRAALAVRVPEATVAAGREAGEGELVLRVAPAATGGVRVELTDDLGTVLLVRRIEPAACAAMVESIAAVIDAYLADRRWPAGASPPAAPVVEAPVVPASPPASPWRGELAASALLGSDIAPGGSIQLIGGWHGARIAGEVGFLWPRPVDVIGTNDATIGEVHVQRGHVIGGLGYERNRTWVILWLGGELVQAKAEGYLFEPTERTAWQTIARNEVGYRIAIGRLSIRLTSMIEVRPDPMVLVLENAKDTTPVAVITATAGLGVSWRLH